MRGQGDVGAFAIFHRVRDDVSAAIDSGYRAQGAELREHPLGALLFEERGRGNPAELKLLLIDLLFVASEGLQNFAQGCCVREFGEKFREYKVSWRGRGFDRGSQMPV